MPVGCAESTGPKSGLNYTVYRMFGFWRKSVGFGRKSVGFGRKSVGFGRGPADFENDRFC